MDQPQAKYFPIIKSPMLPKGSFTGRTAVVTGGGTGLGKGMALTLSALGASVAIFGRRLGVLEETAKELSAQTGNRVLPCQADIRDPEAVKSAVDLVEKELGLPTLVINNAAGNFLAPAEKLTPNGWKTIVDIVLNGTAFVTLDIGKRLIAAQKAGSFLAITTTYTYRGSAYVAPSAAAKAGVENFSRGLAVEWGQYGLRFNCIAPGPISTEGAFSRLDPTGKFTDVMISRMPTGRLGTPEELGNLASYVLSDYASWMTGETILFDGGELTMSAGEFNPLVNLVPKDMWDEMEKLIRESHKKQKEYGKAKL